jgi:hypothetical protein
MDAIVTLLGVVKERLNDQSMWVWEGLGPANAAPVEDENKSFLVLGSGKQDAIVSKPVLKKTTVNNRAKPVSRQTGKKQVFSTPQPAEPNPRNIEKEKVLAGLNEKLRNTTVEAAGVALKKEKDALNKLNEQKHLARSQSSERYYEIAKKADAIELRRSHTPEPPVASYKGKPRESRSKTEQEEFCRERRFSIADRVSEHLRNSPNLKSPGDKAAFTLKEAEKRRDSLF